MRQVEGTVFDARNRRLKRMPVLWLAGFFTVLVCLSITTITLWQLRQARNHELEIADTTVANLSRSMAQQADDAFDQAEIPVAGIVERLSFDGFGAATSSRMHDFLRVTAASVEQVQGLFIYDKEGNWAATSLNRMPDNADNADREYFRFHKSFDSILPHISPAIRSRTTGEWVIPISRRVNDSAGNFAGVVLATLELAYFDRFFDRFDIGKKGVLTLAMADGTILARRPIQENLRGVSIADSELFSKYLKERYEGTATVRSILDQQLRRYGYKRLDRYPLVVLAGLSEEEVLGEWRQYAWRSLAIIMCVVVANLLFGVLLFQQIRFGLNAESQLRIASHSLEKLALQDGLTGLANRRHFQEILGLEFVSGHPNQHPLSLILIDIDFFKTYNDNYGHVAGDKCIAAVAECIRGNLNRTGDLAVRYGGEEMAVFLPHSEVQGAYRLAEKIRLTVLARAIEHRGNPEGIVSISLGVYGCGAQECPSMEALIERADSALYAAKHQGRNRTVTG
ncbi:sensor domain-containing diguanylate cyclase [Pseudomonas sp. LP_7_YM]|uniref:sensor domain-containing diguanylate cyclase n=1 Tax=Pseudomonas sp. LP_7_YM TaxID=2485137 RepID=UPI001060CCFA|nr:sensor domain-containing diguanylate cyclase [Pseudomonas sp. LP_7_YM]TDV70410.1 diguanylate cyclase (GGDEF)-like protein [Pseudomonas sp. LP_7_YM]